MVIERADLKERVLTSPDVPTLPTVVTKLFEIFRNPKADAGKVAEIISEDQALTAKTLRLVNSAFYGFPRKIDNITRAIVIMGFSKVRNIALTASVLGSFKRGKEEGGENEGNVDFDFIGFWEHSLGVAIASEVVAKSVKGIESDDAFVCGLLHDLGKMIVAEFMDEEFQLINQRISETGCLMYEAEEHLFDCHHGLIGKWLAERWKFPPRILVAIQHHHEPMAARESQDIACVVHVADILSRSIGIGYPGDNRIPPIHDPVWQALGLSTELLDNCYKQIFEGLEKAKDFFELISDN